jgi:broad specificity polyphosphatase/5'/3'-nucleotidase SurE
MTMVSIHPVFPLWRNAMREIGEVIIIAPDRERSAVSHSFTMNHPIRVQNLGEECMGH